jgi:uncharacterized protein
MANYTVHVGALAVHLHIPASQSLKEKRRVLKSLKDRIHAHFNVSVSEIGDLDKWQTSVFGISMISNDRDVISGNFEKILTLIEQVAELRITAQQMEFL